MAFEFRMENQGGMQVLTMKGTIDEYADFKKIQVKSNGPLIIDLKEVTHLNSVGLRTWVTWARTLAGHQGDIMLRNCPQVVVHQLNVLEGFAPPNSVVESLEVPFFCEACENQVLYTAQRGRDYTESKNGVPEKIQMPMKMNCKKCGEMMDADIMPVKYFMFLKKKM